MHVECKKMMGNARTTTVKTSFDHSNLISEDVEEDDVQSSN